MINGPGFLGLSRRKGQELIFDLPGGGMIRLIVNDIVGNKIRLAVKAPADVKIWRDEVLRKIANVQPLEKTVPVRAEA